jgi:hypothetical protein
VAFLNWCFGLTKDDRLEDRGGALPRFVERGYPHKSYHHHRHLYIDMGMVMMPKKGVPIDGAMGGSMGSTRPTKPVAVAVWFGL